MIKFIPLILLMNSLWLSELSWSNTLSSNVNEGAKVFMAYCSGCHSLQYLQYDPIIAQLKLNAWANASAEPASRAPYKTSLPPSDAIRWFGRIPPDLSLIAQQRTRLWIQEYLTAFYPENHRPYGVNNALLPNTSMPKPLISKEQALQIAIFLDYTSDPSILIRYQLGPWVILICLGLLCCVYAIKKLYWKKIQSSN